MRERLTKRDKRDKREFIQRCKALALQLGDRRRGSWPDALVSRSEREAFPGRNAYDDGAEAGHGPGGSGWPMKSADRFALVSELRSRTIRLVARCGEETMPNGPWGDKVKVAILDKLRFEVVNGRQLRVGIKRKGYPEMIGETIYDSDDLRHVVDLHLIKVMVLPLMRREMVLDDLASV